MSDHSTSTADRSSRDRRRQLKALLRKKAEESRSFPLSFAQQRLWILDRLDPGNPVYNIPLGHALARPAGPGRLAPHADGSGRPARIAADEDRDRRRPADASRRAGQTADADGRRPGARRAGRARSGGRRPAQSEARKPFRLDESPLFRALLLRFSPTEHVLVVVMHHIISDDWSMAVLFREVALLYQAFRAGQPSPLGPLPVQYADYAVWQRQRLQGELLQRLLDYWRQRLRDVVPLELPTDQSRSLQLELAGGSEEMQLPPALLAGLREAGRREGATLYMTLLAALQVLLYRYSGQEDFTIGSPIAGRVGKETEGLGGLLRQYARHAGGPGWRSQFSELAAANAADRPGRISTPGVAVRAAGRRPEPGAGWKPQSAVSGHVYAAECALAGVDGRRTGALGHPAGHWHVEVRTVVHHAGRTRGTGPIGRLPLRAVPFRHDSPHVEALPSPFGRNRRPAGPADRATPPAGRGRTPSTARRVERHGAGLSDRPVRA